MGIKYFLTVAIVALQVLSASAEPVPEQKSTVAKMTEPHLLPVAPYPDAYLKTVRDTLIGDRRSDFWMLVLPSFSPEYALIVTSTPAPSGGGTKKYEMRWVQAISQIWLKFHHDNKIDLRRSLKRPVDLKQTVISLPPETSGKLRLAWLETLRGVRYDIPKGDIERIVLDGTTYEFFASPSYFGTTWSPHGGAPRKLVDLGECLISSVRASEVERVSRLESCTRIAMEISGVE
jgi:hypothetical protein